MQTKSESHKQERMQDRRPQCTLEIHWRQQLGLRNCLHGRWSFQLDSRKKVDQANSVYLRSLCNCRYDYVPVLRVDPQQQCQELGRMSHPHCFCHSRLHCWFLRCKVGKSRSLYSRSLCWCWHRSDLKQHGLLQNKLGRCAMGDARNLWNCTWSSLIYLVWLHCNYMHINSWRIFVL